MDYSSVRKNGVIGIIRDGDFSIHASEWWSGEGLDILITNKGEKDRRFSLRSDEIENLIALIFAMGFAEDEIIKETIQIIEEQIKRESTRKNFREI